MKPFKITIMENRHLQVVVLIVFFHAVVNYIWLKMDRMPLWFDYGGYFKRSMEIYYASNNGIPELIKGVLGTGPYADVYQPHRLILPLFSLPWYYVFGITADIAVMSCSIFLAISLFSIYCISCRMFDRTTGLLAACILSFSPGFFTFYRRYSPEFACTAMVALAACFLLSAQNFRNRKYSILSGVVFGLSMITKEMAFVFLPGIFIYSVYAAIKEEKSRLLNISLFLFLIAIIVSPLFWLHRLKIMSNIMDVAFSDKIREMFGMVSRFSFSGMAFYIKDMVFFSFPNPYFLFFILGAVLLIVNKAGNRGLLFFWFISSYLLLISAQTRARYYGIPLLIPVSIMAAYGVNNLFRNKTARLISILSLLTFGIFQIFVYSFPFFPSSSSRILNPDGYGNYFYPIADNWKLEDIAGYMRENIDNRDKIIRVHVGANTYPFSPMTLAYSAEQKRIKCAFAGYNTKAEEIISFDFVIVKSGREQGMFYSPRQANEILEALDKNEFIKLSKTFILPDNSVVSIYKNPGR